ncbi:ribosome assembly cofactor RimP [Aquimarina sp. ERC-38]|uniref:ribosome assembly cofactor RimP n=1 Tax=Aquimarina sp. ERC-38 TaxID=2949996 RepID=UPI0022486BEE|nr:ribosome assembly cofactor RimP [Aquimarina sp. ERC-38]UZO81229.1 ribosome assembly cofactor RimP [Aquimarina sp. ERC-38]
MPLQSKVEDLLNKALEDRSDLFLIKMSVHPDHTIEIIIDGDQGVTVEDCIMVSRAIEHNLDREEEDFSLQVMSAGVSEGLVHPRQYPKNVGRKLNVKTADGNQVEGELIQVEEDNIKLTWKTREPKPVGKGKVTVVKEAAIAYEDIKEAKVMITF